MFEIAHDNQFVYSLITVRDIISKNWFDKNIEDLMYLWSNQTAIPYLNKGILKFSPKLLWLFKPKDEKPKPR